MLVQQSNQPFGLLRFTPLGEEAALAISLDSCDLFAYSTQDVLADFGSTSLRLTISSQPAPPFR